MCCTVFCAGIGSRCDYPVLNRWIVFGTKSPRSLHDMRHQYVMHSLLMTKMPA